MTEVDALLKRAGNKAICINLALCPNCKETDEFHMSYCYRPILFRIKKGLEVDNDKKESH